MISPIVLIILDSCTSLVKTVASVQMVSHMVIAKALPSARASVRPPVRPSVCLPIHLTTVRPTVCLLVLAFLPVCLSARPSALWVFGSWGQQAQ